jgi:hypothetical protein
VSTELWDYLAESPKKSEVSARILSFGLRTQVFDGQKGHPAARPVRGWKRSIGAGCATKEGYFLM